MLIVIVDPCTVCLNVAVDTVRHFCSLSSRFCHAESAANVSAPISTAFHFRAERREHFISSHFSLLVTRLMSVSRDSFPVCHKLSSRWVRRQHQFANGISSATPTSFEPVSIYTLLHHTTICLPSMAIAVLSGD